MRFKPRSIYDVLALVSFFLVVGGGTALASYVVSSNSQIGRGTVSGHEPPGGKHANIIKESVNGADIAPQSIGSGNLATGAVSNPKLANGAVSNTKLANGAVTNAKLLGGAVGTRKLADGAVTGPKLAGNSVNGFNVQDGSLSGQDISNGAITTNKVGQGFLTQAGGNRALQFYAHEWNTAITTNNNIAFGRVTLVPLAANQFKVCFNFIGTWGYGISVNGGALVTRTPATPCGPTETLTTGGSFEITDGQDVIFGSGEPTTSGYYFVYAFYSP